MVILCNIRLHRPPNGTFTPNGIVTGAIHYSVDEPTPVSNITVSLKGMGRLNIRKKRGDNTIHYLADEEYMNINFNVDKKDDGIIPTGSYEVPFQFLLPSDIPSSYTYEKSQVDKYIYCKISYSIRIDFNRPGLLNFDKKFQQEIIVVRDKVIIPKYPDQPIIIGDKKKLFQLFRKSYITLKVRMPNSIVPPGGKVHFEYEILNESNLSLKGIDIKLAETHTFTTPPHTWEQIISEFPPSYTMWSGPILAGHTEKAPITLPVPPEALSIDRSKIVCRDYVILITVQIPGPHINLNLKVPFQVGYKPGETSTQPDVEVHDFDDNPPSYWEAMAEFDGEG